MRRPGTGGPWGTGLLVLGVAATAQGVGYATAPTSSLSGALAALADIVPMPLWAGLWVAAGLWAVGCALRPPQRNRDVWPIAGVISLWSAAYLVHWLILGLAFDDWTRTWATAVAWGSLAGLVVSWGRCVNPPKARR